MKEPLKLDVGITYNTASKNKYELKLLLGESYHVEYEIINDSIDFDIKVIDAIQELKSVFYNYVESKKPDEEKNQNEYRAITSARYIEEE